MGLRPAGENGIFEQPVHTVKRRVGPSSLTIDDTVRLSLWRDFIPLPWPWGTRPMGRAESVYGGTIGDTPPIDVEGHFVILNQPGRTVIPRIGPNDPLSKAAAVAVVGLESFTSQRLAPIAAGLSAGLEGDSSARRVAPASLLITTALAERLLGRRLTDMKPGGRGTIVRGSMVFADSIELTCCNLIAVIPGADSALAREYVALGAHVDHLGTAAIAVDHDSLRAVNARIWDLGRGTSPPNAAPDAGAGMSVNLDSMRRVQPTRRDSIFNGADDDGSGTVALLGIAQALVSAEPKPRRSILFVWHTGEELGNQGSTWFTSHPTVPLDSIVTQLNLDMIGRGSAQDILGGGAEYLEVIGSRRLSRSLGDLIESVNQHRQRPFKLDFSHDSPSDPNHLYCRSDHFEYARRGIPIAFFTTGEHRDYHQVTDEVQYIDLAKLAAVSRLVRDVALRLASDDSRPRLDRPRPDPSQGCRG
jgi:hypothetical protein